MGAIRCALCAQRVLCSYTPLLARYASTTPRVTPSPSTKTSTRAPPPVAPKRSIPSGPKAETRPKQSSKVVSPRVPPAPRPSSSKNSAPAPSFPLPPPSARKTGPKSTVRKATTRKAAPTAQSNEPVLPEQSSKEAEDDDIENRSFVESVRRQSLRLSSSGQLMILRIDTEPLVPHRWITRSWSRGRMGHGQVCTRGQG